MDLARAQATVRRIVTVQFRCCMADTGMPPNRYGCSCKPPVTQVAVAVLCCAVHSGVSANPYPINPKPAHSSRS